MLNHYVNGISAKKFVDVRDICENISRYLAALVLINQVAIVGKMTYYVSKHNAHITFSYDGFEDICAILPKHNCPLRDVYIRKLLCSYASRKYCYILA